MNRILQKYSFVVIMAVIILGEVKVYSSEKSPWGTIIVYPPVTLRLDEQRADYWAQLDSARACGFSWDRPNCGPGVVIYPTTIFDFDACDTLKKWLQRYGFEGYMGGWPPHWSPWKTDSTQWVEFFHTVVEHYDGDGQGYGGHPEMVGLTTPVKYWEICNEPNSKYTILPCFTGNMEHFRRYVRNSHKGIKLADPDAKVVAPSINDYIWYKNSTQCDTGTSAVYWLARVLENGGTQYIDVISHHYLFRDGMLKAGWQGNFLSYSDYLDCLEDTIKHYYGTDKPIWLTEDGLATCIKDTKDTTGLDSICDCNGEYFVKGDCHGWDSVSLNSQALCYKEWCNEIVKRDWTNKGSKIFFFCLKDQLDRRPGPGAGWPFAILDTIFRHKPSFDSLQRFIYFTSEQNDPTSYNNQRKLVIDGSGNSHLVTDGYGDIRYAMITDGEINWKNYTIVGDGKYPAMAIDNNGGINVCWIGEKVVSGAVYEVLYYSKDFGPAYEVFAMQIETPGYDGFTPLLATPISFIVYHKVTRWLNMQPEIRVNGDGIMDSRILVQLHLLM
ncbi:MAG: hypothetical protein HY769_02740 [Candidatus Stahlbacteria bacterium]|nr:hypothetical protein [Candidatus Stahlbacteria bacterium]